MPVVTNTIRTPGGTTPTGRVSITLVGSNANPVAGYVTASDYTVESYTTTAIVDGVWAVTLTANSLINPSGTRYKVSENINDQVTVYYLNVPNGAGPYFVEDILSEPPASIASPALDTHAADTTNIHGIVDTAQLATLNTAQTITGAKTFSPAVAYNGTTLSNTDPNGYGAVATAAVRAIYATVTNAAGVPLEVRGAASQTGDLFRATNSAGTVLAQVQASGAILTNGGYIGNPSGTFAHFIPKAASYRGLIVQGAASQTADLQQWQNSAGTVLATSSAGGSLRSATQVVVGSTSNPIGAPLTVINTLGTGVTAAVIQGQASQTADLQQWQNSAGTVLARVHADGGFTGNTYGVFGASADSTVRARLTVYATSAADQPLVVQGFASQTADLQRWQDSGANRLAWVTAAGHIGASFAAVTGTRTLELGAVDSAGVGYRTVRVAN